jgi:tRNA 2-selenouridine synthase
MPITKLLAADFIAFAQTNNAIIIDVRAPSEYEGGHIIGAYNMPLFTNEERAKVGTAYKKQSRQQAIKIGLDFFGNKMKPIIEQVEKWIKTRKQTNNIVMVHCWRGGMRSGAIAWLLDLYGFETYLLVGGYKSFRQLVLLTFEKPINFKVLGGRTGSNKTILLQKMAANGHQIIDLEALAHHRGSAFGGINQLPPPTQEMFENRLYWALLVLNTNLPIWAEDESRRIGSVHIPEKIWAQMRMAPLMYLTLPFELRLDNIMNDYSALPIEKLKESTIRIQKKLGGLVCQQVCQQLENGQIRQAFEALLTYYDKVYDEATEKRRDATVIPITMAELF